MPNCIYFLKNGLVIDKFLTKFQNLLNYLKKMLKRSCKSVSVCVKMYTNMFLQKSWLLQHVTILSEGSTERSKK